jgi:urease accessory protein
MSDRGEEGTTTATVTPPELAGRVGRLTAVAGQVAGRTVLRSLYSEGTLKAMRVHHLDAEVPGMAHLTIASPGGGVLQGDRLELEIAVEPGAQLSVGTTSATRVYAMPRGGAEARTNVVVSPGAYLELVPDPFIPFAGSRYSARSCHVVGETGALLAAEVVGPGRQGRGESLAYEWFNSETEVRRPDGTLLFRDSTRLCPAQNPASPGLLGSRCALGVLYAVAGGLDASVFDDALAQTGDWKVICGCRELPNGAGAWYRVLADDAPTAQAAVGAAWRAARRHLLGCDPPASRRY